MYAPFNGHKLDVPPQFLGPERCDRCGLSEKKPSGAMDKQYEKVAEAAMADLEGGMCWPVEWFKEDLLEPQEMWGDVDGTWILENRIC